MRIAFDLDGVLADLQTLLADAAERLFAASGRAPTSPASPANGGGSADIEGNDAASVPAEESADDEPVPALFEQLTAEQQRRLWQRVLETENFWETLNETEPGIVGRLAVLALERRWEVIFITQRPSSSGDTCQLQSQRWLTRHGFAFPSVFVIRGSRGRVATALDLDVVVDDRPDNCLDVVIESKARAFLVWRGDPASPAAVSARRLNIEVVQSVSQCLDQLAKERDEKATGLFGRLKRLMGAS